MSRIVLASTSRYKAAVLMRAGIEFEAVSPQVEESHIPGESAEEMALRLAREKAMAVADLHPEAFVIGADQVVEFEGRILGKPGSSEKAVQQLERMSGRTHRLITGIAVVRGSDVAQELVIHHMNMRSLSPAEIRRYVEADQSHDTAGAYKIEQRGITLFDSISGPDPSAIEGLPVMSLVRLLKRLGAGQL